MLEATFTLTFRDLLRQLYDEVGPLIDDLSDAYSRRAFTSALNDAMLVRLDEIYRVVEPLREFAAEGGDHQLAQFFDTLVYVCAEASMGAPGKGLDDLIRERKLLD